MVRRLSVDDLHDFEFPSRPAISPDGRRIVYVLRTADHDEDRMVSSLWHVRVDGGAARQLTRGTADTAPAWSPDGEQIAFLRADDGPAQLWLLPADVGEPERVTSLPFGAGTPTWHSGGGSIAFTAATDLSAEQNRGLRATDGAAPFVVDRPGRPSEATGLSTALRSHVHVLDLASREVRQVTSGDWHAGDPVWSPKGDRLAFTRRQHAGTGQPSHPGAWVVDPFESGAVPEPVGPGGSAYEAVGWSADGASLLVAGRRTTATGPLSLLQATLSGETIELTPGRHLDVTAAGEGFPGVCLQATPDGGTVLFRVRERGCSQICALDVASGTLRRVIGGAGTSVSEWTVANGVVAVVLTTPTSYGEIATVDLTGGEPAVHTAHSFDKAELFTPDEREFVVSDGTVVSGWLLRDPARSSPAPLLLDIHDGPRRGWGATADGARVYHQELVAQGWVILLLNPRDTEGYGDRFRSGVLGDVGLDDIDDFLEPLDELVAEGVADPQRLAVTGYGYGGFMTCRLTGRDNRFAAAVAGGTLGDLDRSEAGRYLGVAEPDGTSSAAGPRGNALSPFALVDRVRTPTLLLHGADDEFWRTGQAEAWFSALREQRVRSELVFYPGATHSFVLDGRPSHRVDFNRRVVEWIRRHTGAPGQPRYVALEAKHWRRRLVELTRKHRVPGAVLGILRPDAREQVMLASCGVLNTRTGVEVTDDSVFQIGSITKVWTTTVVMQLVDEGRVGLDTPVVEVLPELRLANPVVTRQVTLRHLLTHTSGIAGDVFIDTGRGDDCLEKFVDELAGVAQIHPLGATFSYCNAGFSLVGRVIEVLTGKTWDEAVRERLFEPLGLTRTGTLPEEALRFRAALGHLVTDAGELQPAPIWGFPRSTGPAGLITASAADVLAFSRLHLTGGLGPDGARVISESSVSAMTEKQVDLVDKHTIGDSWGLGWIRFRWGGRQVIGYDGNTIGQAAFLRLLAEPRLAVTLLVNGGNTRDLCEDLFHEVFAEYADIELPAPLAVPAPPPEADIMAHLGVYERESVRIEILVGDRGPRIRQTVTGALAAPALAVTDEDDLVPLGADRFAYRPEGMRSWLPVTFYRLPTGERYVHTALRAAPKVD